MKFFDWFKEGSSAANGNQNSITESDESRNKNIQAMRNAQALEFSSTAFMMADIDLNIIYANKAVITLLKNLEEDIKAALPNFSADNLLGQNIDIFHKQPSHQRGMLAGLKSTHQSSIEVGRLNFRLTLSPLFDDKGVNIGTVVEWLEQTDLLVKAGMLDALDRSQAVIEFTPDGIIKSANQNFLNTVGYRLEDIQGKHHKMFVDPNYSNSVEYSMFWQNLNRGEFSTGEYKRFANGGREVWLQASYNPIMNSAGKVTGVIKYAADITSRKAAINDVKRVLMTLSTGDLTTSIEREFEGEFKELGDAINSFIANLNETISQITSATRTINDASGEIAQGNADLSSRTEQQASSLEETASSMEELTGTVKLNSENAIQANSLASEASGVAIDGGNIIKDVVTTMSSINESARKISDIIGVIDGIAFQTNILALNAAVEAARAGEQGRGFAVVASEVRTLAQRSADAAKDIKELISDSVKKIENGNVLVNQSGDTMEKIVTSIKRVNDIMSEIAAASKEQATGIDEVGKAVMQMDEVTQQNAALVEQAAAAAESLQSQAEQLADRVSTFKIDDAYNDLPERNIERLVKPETNKRLSSRSPQKKIRAASPEEDEWESF
ncbi:methyl-accepting chemotaxis protein [Shewanella sp. TC10]|uniref:methyl-accepting chemotaxis protein n=1 Tax=Shewanella sp. TC10 TaxID=1419739 RepID=UPI003A7F2A27